MKTNKFELATASMSELVAEEKRLNKSAKRYFIAAAIAISFGLGSLATIAAFKHDGLIPTEPNN